MSDMLSLSGWQFPDLSLTGRPLSSQVDEFRRRQAKERRDSIRVMQWNMALLWPAKSFNGSLLQT